MIAEALDIEEIGEPFTDILTQHVVLQHPKNWRRILAPILKHMFLESFCVCFFFLNLRFLLAALTGSSGRFYCSTWRIKVHPIMGPKLPMNW